MAAVMTARAPPRSKREYENSLIPKTPNSKSPRAKLQRNDKSTEEDKENKSDRILRRLDEIETSIMASVQTLLSDFKSKLEIQMKEEMKKMEISIVATIKKKVDEKLEKIKRQFNDITNFVQSCLEEQLATVREHAIHNEQYSRKNSVRISGIPEEDGENVEEKTIQFFKSELKIDVPSSAIEISHRVGQRRHAVTGQTGQSRSRQVIVKFASHKTKQSIMMA